MNEATVSTSAPWRRWFVIGAGVGVGAVVAAVVMIVVLVWYSNSNRYSDRPAPLPAPPPPWDRIAITATFADLSLWRNDERLVFTFRYTLENHTGGDWRLPTADSLYKVLADGKGLERDLDLAWAPPPFSAYEPRPSVPAGQRINVGLQIQYWHTGAREMALEKLDEFMKRQLDEIEGFAALDEFRRYDLRFPKPPEVKVRETAAW